MHDHSICLLSDLSFPAFRSIPVWNESSVLVQFVQLVQLVHDTVSRAAGFRNVSFVMNKYEYLYGFKYDIYLNNTSLDWDRALKFGIFPNALFSDLYVALSLMLIFADVKTLT
jgi:hypothetical protein